MTKFTLIDGGNDGAPTDHMRGLIDDMSNMPREDVSLTANIAYAELHDELAGTDDDRAPDWFTVARASLILAGASISMIGRDTDTGSAA